jgi:hypothetical protein
MYICTGDRKIPNEIVRVGCLEPLLQTDIAEFATNYWRDVEVRELLQYTLELEWFTMSLSLSLLGNTFALRLGCQRFSRHVAKSWDVRASRRESRQLYIWSFLGHYVACSSTTHDFGMLETFHAEIASSHGFLEICIRDGGVIS